MKIYLAGGFCWNEDDWRYDLVRGLNAEPIITSVCLPQWEPLPRAIFGCFDFTGPYPVPMDRNEMFMVRQAIEMSDFVFAWADSLIPSEVSKISAEIVYARAIGKLVGVGSTSQGNPALAAIWTAQVIGSFFPFNFLADTPELSLRDCLKTLLGFSPLLSRMALWKNSMSRPFFEHGLDRAGYVYLIRADTGHYKIGRTINVPKRMKLFTVKLPFEFEIINYFPCDDMFEAETELHATFKNDRVNGEWFTLSKEDIELLNTVSYFEQSQFYNSNHRYIDVGNLRGSERSGKPWYTDEEFKKLIKRQED